MNEQEFAELAAGHALKALSAEDEARYAVALREHPEWTAIADADAETAAGLAEAATPVAPDASLRAALLAQIAHTPQLPAEQAPEEAAEAVPAPLATPGPRRRALRRLFALAASVVLLVGLGIGAIALSSQLNRPASVVALEEITAAEDARQASVPLEGGGTATAHWSVERGEAVLIADGLEPLDADQSYQLWFVRGETPLPAGVFESDAGEVTALLDGELHEGDVIAVTVEVAGGSPTGLPTSDPVLAIPTA